MENFSIEQLQETEKGYEMDLIDNLQRFIPGSRNLYLIFSMLLFVIALFLPAYDVSFSNGTVRVPPNTYGAKEEQCSGAILFFGKPAITLVGQAVHPGLFPTEDVFSLIWFGCNLLLFYLWFQGFREPFLPHPWLALICVLVASRVLWRFQFETSDYKGDSPPYTVWTFLYGSYIWFVAHFCILIAQFKV